MKKTKIICTIGPASGNKETIKKLIENGMNCARINFSHGDHESHGKTMQFVKDAREELGTNTALLLDTKGPEIRTKVLKDGDVKLEAGNTFTFTTREIEGDDTIVSVTYENFHNDLKVGARVLVDDGLIELVVKEIKDQDVICEIINGGLLGSRKGVNLPDVYVNLPALSEKDISDIKFGITQGINYIAASFIRCADDVNQIKKLLADNNGSHIHIISKIENRDGVNNIDEIIEVSDGIMVARGDLGVEIPTEEVPQVQKLLIKKTNAAGKIVVTATQMLESMVTNPRPTRAEANDVANAIYDGTDVTMLSGETAKGSYPVEAVATMAKIAEEAEKFVDYSKRTQERHENIILNDAVTDAISYSACAIAQDIEAECIATGTATGRTARMVSRFRPAAPIIAITNNENVWRQMSLVWGCKAILDEDNKMVEGDYFENVKAEVVAKGFVKAEDKIVVVGGTPVGKSGSTNSIKVMN